MKPNPFIYVIVWSDTESPWLCISGVNGHEVYGRVGFVRAIFYMLPDRKYCSRTKVRSINLGDKRERAGRERNEWYNQLFQSLLHHPM